MRTEIPLADGGELAVGHDHAVGFFATLQRGRRYEFDRFAASFDGDRPLDALLQWLVAHGVFTEGDLDDALFAHADPGDDEEQLSPGAALALRVIEALKTAAAE